MSNFSCDDNRASLNTLSWWSVRRGAWVRKRNMRTNFSKSAVFFLNGKYEHRAWSPSFVSYMTNTNCSVEVWPESQYLDNVMVSHVREQVQQRNPSPLVVGIMFQVVDFSETIRNYTIACNQIRTLHRTTIAKRQRTVFQDRQNTPPGTVTIQ